MADRLGASVAETRGRSSSFLVLTLFAAILIAGLFAYDDYGIPYDAEIERTTTLVNLKYILSAVAPDYPLPPVLAAQPELTDWVDRYYGVAIQLPTAIFEWIFGFRFISPTVYKIRNLWIFLQFFIGLIFFFRLLKLRFGSDRAAAVGVLLLWLSPRIFADSFYNIKDLPFLSWILIAVYFLFKWLENDSRVELILFAVTAAVVTNIRVIGGLLVLIWIGVILERWFRREISFRRAVADGALFFGVYALVWIAITPLAWRRPIAVMIDTVRTFSDYPHISDELYFGKLTLNSKLPWHYLPVWIGITSPVLVLPGFFAGGFRFLRNLGFARRLDVRRDGVALILALLPIGLAIGLGSTLYNGWRHFYFVYPWTVYFAVLWLDQLFHSSRIIVRVSAWALLSVSLISLGVWIIRFHPYQMVYFNALIPKNERKNFEKDYWCVACRDALSTIVDSDANLRIVISSNSVYLIPSLSAFPNSDRERIYPADWSDDYSEKDYIFVSYSGRMADGFDFPSFELENQFIVDDLPLYGIYRRVMNRRIPNERFSVTLTHESKVEGLSVLNDWDRGTSWTYDESERRDKAVLTIEFSEPAAVDGITLQTVIQRNGLPDEVLISTSVDGETFDPVELTDSSYSEFFFEPVEARFLRIEGAELGTRWNINEIQVWDASEAAVR